MNTMEVSGILGVGEATVRKAVADQKLIATKEENGTLTIEENDVLLYILTNKKYKDKMYNFINYLVKNNKIQIPQEDTTDDISHLQKQIIKSLIRNDGTDIIGAFNEHLMNLNAKEKLTTLLREIGNKVYVTKQPKCGEMISMLENVLSVGEHDRIKVGAEMSGAKLEEIFGRNPQQEGINFCKDTKELFIITKIGSDNKLMQLAEYNDYWHQGKIMYEGKGKTIQEVKGSNLHLYRKFEVFHNKIRCKEGVPSYIHVFNKVSNTEENRFIYLGIYDVTDIFVNEHSMSADKIDTKTAIVFELTPRVNRKSKDIDENYIF